MRVAALIPLIGCVFNLFLAVFVFSRAPRATQNRVYFFLGVFISVWNLGQFFLFTTTSPDVAQFWVRFLWVGVIFIPMLLFHLSMLIAQTKVGRVIPVIYALLGALVLTVPTQFFIKGVHHLGRSGWYAYAGPGLYLAMLPFSLMFISIIILLRKRRSLPRVYGARLTALILAQSMLAVFGTNDTLPLVSLYHYPGTLIEVYPYGSIAAVFVQPSYPLLFLPFFTASSSPIRSCKINCSERALRSVARSPTSSVSAFCSRLPPDSSLPQRHLRACSIPRPARSGLHSAFSSRVRSSRRRFSRGYSGAVEWKNGSSDSWATASSRRIRFAASWKTWPGTPTSARS